MKMRIARREMREFEFRRRRKIRGIDLRSAHGYGKKFSFAARGASVLRRAYKSARRHADATS